jgi:predicted RNase H-like HicB family nuclease
VIERLLGAGVSFPSVLKAARYLRERFRSVVRPPVRLTLIAEGKRILVCTLEGKHLLDATANGLLTISFAVGPIAEDLRGKVNSLSAPRSISVRVKGCAYEAILTPDLVAGGYSIEIPSLPGVITESDTLREARPMVADAIRLRLEVQARPTPSRMACGRRI